MKTKSILSILMLFWGMITFAQHPLVGTWEMVSIKGVGEDGKPYSWNKSSLRITKVITPTHYMLIQHIVRNDSVIFNSAHAGTVQLEDNKYSQTQTISSNAATIGTKSEYSCKLNGNQLIQAASFTAPDGKKSVIDELIFMKTSSQAATKNPLVGTWNQLSSEYTSFDGTKDSHTSPAVTRFDIFTPTHWMRIAHRDNLFESAVIGTYSVQNDKIILMIILSSSSTPVKNQYDITYRVDGSKLYVKGIATNPEGKKLTWSDVFEKVSN